MKKIGTLNSHITYLISRLGHTDQILICDAGLPIPAHVERIDLALKPGIPSFLDTLDVVLQEMQVEKVYFAKELEEVSPVVKKALEKRLENMAQQIIRHQELKEMSKKAKAIIRTGECTPYANVILESGVIF